MNSFNTFHSNINKQNLFFKPGLYFSIYEGYHGENVNYDNSASIKTGYTSGYTNSITNISIGTNNQIPLTGAIENYTVVWNGYFRSNYTGIHTFRLNSDDGSYLWIGNIAITGYTRQTATVDDGGLHGMVTKTGTASLTSGTYYPIRIMFGEKGGGDDCTVSWSTDGGTNYQSIGIGFFFSK